MVTFLLFVLVCAVKSIILDATTPNKFISLSVGSNSMTSGSSWSITSPSTSPPGEWGIELHLASDKYGFRSGSSLSTISIIIDGFCNTGECDALYAFGVDNKYIAFMHDFDGGVKPHNTANPFGGLFITPHCHGNLHNNDMSNILPPSVLTNDLAADIRTSLSNGNTENWQILSSTRNDDAWPVGFQIINDNINNNSSITFYSPTFPDGVMCSFNESFAVNKDFKFGIIPDVNDESFTIDNFEIENMNTGQFSFGIFVGVTGVGNARSSGPLTITLYWDTNIFQCVLIPSKGNSWILCDSTHDSFVAYEDCLTQPQYKMHLSLPSNDGLWIDQLIVNEYNMNITYDTFCSLLDFEPANTETTHCTEWDVPKWSWICMDVDNNCNQYQALDIILSDTNQVFVETPQSNNAYIPDTCTISTLSPTEIPTNIPTNIPTISPTNVPTNMPTNIPTNMPSKSPTPYPTTQPTLNPTKAPTGNPFIQPTMLPTSIPNTFPTYSPITPKPTLRINSFPTMDATHIVAISTTDENESEVTNIDTFLENESVFDREYMAYVIILCVVFTLICSVLIFYLYWRKHDKSKVQMEDENMNGIGIKHENVMSSTVDLSTIEGSYDLNETQSIHNQGKKNVQLSPVQNALNSVSNNNFLDIDMRINGMANEIVNDMSSNEGSKTLNDEFVIDGHETDKGDVSYDNNSENEIDDISINTQNENSDQFLQEMNNQMVAHNVLMDDIVNQIIETPQ